MRQKQYPIGSNSSQPNPLSERVSEWVSECRPGVSPAYGNGPSRLRCPPIGDHRDSGAEFNATGPNPSLGFGEGRATQTCMGPPRHWPAKPRTLGWNWTLGKTAHFALQEQSSSHDDPTPKY